MAEHLRISLDTNVSGVLPVHVTPVDIVEPDKLATVVHEAISIADLADAVPGDGKFETDTRLKFPLHLAGHNFMIDVPVRVTVESH